MSNQNETTVGDVLFQKVYAPAFLAKCAEFGIAPANEDEMASLLEIAAGVRIKEAELAAEKSTEASTVIKAAAAGMRNILGVAAPATQANTDSIKAAQADPQVQAALAALRQ